MLAKIGPGLKSNRCSIWLNMLVPTTSEGSRSEVNWMRWNEQWNEFASACASVVLPTPGTSSTSRWPLASIATMARRMTSSLPRMTRAIELCNCAIWFAVAVVIGLKILVASVTNIGCGPYFYTKRPDLIGTWSLLE